MSYQGKYPAAFINAIWEEGTKDEAIEYLQREWDKNCDMTAELSRTREALKEVLQAWSNFGALAGMDKDWPGWERIAAIRKENGIE